MSQLDSQGNWHSTLPDPDPYPATCSGDICGGAGAPAVGTGSDGNLYIDTDTGDIYQNVDGTWTLITSGGGGASNLHGSGSPEAATTAAVGTLYLDDDTNGFYWKKTGSGNTGWVALIG